MKRALVLYHSQTGTTKKFARAIAEYCLKNNVDANAMSISNFKLNDLDKADYLFLGCWTHGLLVFNQHPTVEWIQFVKSLPNLNDKKVVLFTTYKIATGSMFRKMKANLPVNTEFLNLTLKSRNGKLSEAQSMQISDLVLKLD